MASSTDEPNLPQDYYCGFDVRNTPDGGKEYALPEDAGATADRSATIGANIFAMAVVVFFAVIYLSDSDLTILGHPRLRDQPFADFLLWLAVCMTCWLVVWIALFVAYRIWLAISGYQVKTYIGIRTDGLVWNRTAFFPREHIRDICIDTDNNVCMQIGLNSVELATCIEQTAAHLFIDLFRRDRRRYWHGHN